MGNILCGSTNNVQNNELLVKAALKEPVKEDIKKEGGIEYKGAKSFLIAKKNSQNQENFWEQILKEKYGEDIGTQFKYENCIFDFINILKKRLLNKNKPNFISIIRDPMSRLKSSFFQLNHDFNYTKENINFITIY